MLPAFFVPFNERRLSAQTESLHDGTIAFNVVLVEIVKKRTTLAYELSQRASGDIVLVVCLHMLCEVLDAVGEQRNLAFCRTGIFNTALAILVENLFFLCLV